MTRWLALIALCSATPLGAQQVEIEGGRSEGVTTVNVVAGNNNAQANVGLLALGERGATGAFVAQHHAGHAPNSVVSRVSIAAGAFRNSSGWLAIAGSSGNANQQANVALFSLGIEAGAAADALLAQSRASTGPSADLSSAGIPERSVAMGDGALENSTGLVQVSLVGGDRNTSANSFALTFDGGAFSNGN